MCKSLCWGCENSETGKVLRTKPHAYGQWYFQSDRFKHLLRGDFVAIQKVPGLLNWEKAWKKDLFCQDIEGTWFPNAFTSVLSHSKFYLFFKLWDLVSLQIKLGFVFKSSFTVLRTTSWRKRFTQICLSILASLESHHITLDCEEHIYFQWKATRIFL